MMNLRNHLPFGVAPGFGQLLATPGFATTQSLQSFPTMPYAQNPSYVRYAEIGNFADYLLGRTWTSWSPATFG